MRTIADQIACLRSSLDIIERDVREPDATTAEGIYLAAISVKLNAIKAALRVAGHATTVAEDILFDEVED